MTTAPSHLILRTTLVSLLIWSVGQLPTHLDALPTDKSLEVCGYEDASFQNLMLPVLPGDPHAEGKKKDIVFDLLISPEGELTASAPFYAPSKDFVSPVRRALAHCTFDPALECDEPASGFIRHAVTDYFYLTDSDSDGETIPPEPRWILDPYLINQLETFYRWSGDKEGVRIDFVIDAEGHISGLVGRTKAARILIEHFFKPLKDRLVFAPATQSGEPVGSHLTLRLSAMHSSAYTSNKQMKASKFEPMPRNPKSESEGEEIIVAATISFDYDGEVYSARVDPGTPSSLTTAVIAAVRAWSYLPEDSGSGPVKSTISCRFGFAPGEKKAFLLEEPQKVIWALPVPTKEVTPVFPYELKKAGLSGRAEVTFTVTPKGKARAIKVKNSSHPAFSRAATKAVGDWRFKPGRRNGEPVEFRMMLPFMFNLTN